jgi:hypothetical protein
MFLELSCSFRGFTFDVLYSDAVVPVVWIGTEEVVYSYHKIPFS